MVSSTVITDKIKTLSDLQKYYNLQQADSEEFFNELQEELPALSLEEQAGINRTDLASLRYI